MKFRMKMQPGPLRSDLTRRQKPKALTSNYLPLDRYQKHDFLFHVLSLHLGTLAHGSLPISGHCVKIEASAVGDSAVSLSCKDK